MRDPCPWPLRQSRPVPSTESEQPQAETRHLHKAGTGRDGPECPGGGQAERSEQGSEGWDKQPKPTNGEAAQGSGPFSLQATLKPCRPLRRAGPVLSGPSSLLLPPLAPPPRSKAKQGEAWGHPGVWLRRVFPAPPMSFRFVLSGGAAGFDPGVQHAVCQAGLFMRIGQASLTVFPV